MTVLSSVMRRVQTATLSRQARRVREERLTYLKPEKLHRLESTADKILRSGVPGDVLEFGVAMGGSAILLAGHARRAGRRFAGFDVFGMIPPPTSEKDDAKSKERYEVIAGGKAAGIGGDSYYGYRDDLYEDVRRAFARHGLPVDDERIRLIKGLFEETWPAYGAGAVAFAHVDCDWYDPVRYCLEALAETLSPGGAVVLDDYKDYGGCRAATDEFVAAHPGFQLETGANAILRRMA